MVTFVTPAPVLSPEAAESVGDVSACTIEPPADFQSYIKGRKSLCWRTINTGVANASLVASAVLGTPQTLTSDDCNKVQVINITGATAGACALLYLPRIDDSVGGEIKIILASASNNQTLVVASQGSQGVGADDILANMGIADQSIIVATSIIAANSGAGTTYNVTGEPALGSANYVYTSGAGAVLNCLNIGNSWFVQGSGALATFAVKS
jgi:hypothetical protein